MRAGLGLRFVRELEQEELISLISNRCDVFK